MNVSETQPKKYSNNYHAIYQRNQRKKMIKLDPLCLRKTVWVVEVGDKQIVFKNKKDVKIKRINKNQLREDYIIAF